MALSAEYLSTAQSAIEQIAKRCKNENDERCRDAKLIALILALMRCIYDAGEHTARTRRNTAVCAAQRGARAAGTDRRRQMPAVDRTILKA